MPGPVKLQDYREEVTPEQAAEFAATPLSGPVPMPAPKAAPAPAQKPAGILEGLGYGITKGVAKLGSFLEQGGVGGLMPEHPRTATEIILDQYAPEKREGAKAYMKHVGDTAPISTAVGDVAAQVGTSILGGGMARAEGAGAWVNPGVEAAKRVGFGPIAKHFVGNAAEGAILGSADAGLEAASRDYLETGQVNPDHVAAARLEGAKYGGAGGLILGGSLSLLGEHLPGIAKKLGNLAEREGGIDWLKRQGVAKPAQIFGSAEKAGQAGQEYFAKAAAAAEDIAQGGTGTPKGDTPFAGTLRGVLEAEADQGRGVARGAVEAAVGRLEGRKAGLENALEGLHNSIYDAGVAERKVLTSEAANAAREATEKVIADQPSWAPLEWEIRAIEKRLNAPPGDGLSEVFVGAENTTKRAGKGQIVDEMAPTLEAVTQRNPAKPYGEAERAADMARLEELVPQVTKLRELHNQATEKAMQPFRQALDDLDQRLVKEQGTIERPLVKQLEDVAKLKAEYGKLADNAAEVDIPQLRKFAAKMEQTFPGSGKELTAQLDIAQAKLAMNSALQEAIKNPEGALLRNAWKLGRRVLAPGALGYTLGPKGLAAGLAVDALDLAVTKFRPDLYIQTSQKAAAAAKVIAAKSAVDSAANSALTSMRRGFVPSAAAKMVNYGPSGVGRDNKVTRDNQRMQAALAPHNVDALAARLDQIVAPAAYKDALLGKASMIATNLARNSPKPIVEASTFGNVPRYSDSDVMAFEEYSSVAADPMVAIKALKAGGLTQAQARSLRENYPEIVDQIRNAVLDHADKPLPEQALRKLEILLDQPLAMSKEDSDLIQRQFDQMNRAKNDGSQGGGSIPTDRTARARTIRTDSEKVQGR